MKGKTEAKRMMTKLKKINTALPGLLFGIILFGAVCQAAGFFFTTDKADYSIGLWTGVLTAIFMAFHMAVTLNSVVERDVKGAQAAATVQNIIRYLIAISVIVILAVTGIGNPLSAFAGIMGLKISAYIQPFLAKLYHKGQKENSPEANCKTE